MCRGLRFNICGLKSSYTSEEPLMENVSLELVYASQFWANHIKMSSAPARDQRNQDTKPGARDLRNIDTKTDVRGATGREQREPDTKAEAQGGNIRDQPETGAKTDAAARVQQNLGTRPDARPAKDEHNPEAKADETAQRKRDAEILKLMKNFLLENQWLYWLEVLSALGSVNEGPKLLAFAAEWLQSSGGKELCNLAKDASRFVSIFRAPIAFNPAHIYLSAVPFCPRSSPLFKQLESHFPARISALTHGDGVSWSPLHFSFVAHSSVVYDMALSLDRKRAVAGLDDGTLRVFDLSTGNSVTAVGLGGDGGPIRAVVLLGKQIIAGSHDGGIRMWDADSGIQLGETLQAHTDWIRGMDLSPGGGNQLVSCSDDGTIRIIDVTTTALKMSTNPLKGHNGYVTAVAWASVSTIVSGGSDNAVRVWDKSTGLTIGNPMIGHTSWVLAVAVSPSEEFIASEGSDHNIILWHLEERTQIRSFAGHTQDLRALTFSEDGRHLFSASYDSTIRVWDVQNGRPLCTPLMGHSDGVMCLCLLPEGRVLSSGVDGFVNTWDLSHLSESVLSPPSSGSIIITAYMADGKTLACTNGHRSWMWNTETGSSDGRFFIDDEPIPANCAVNLSPDGRLAAIGTDRGARVYDIATGQRMRWTSGSSLGSKKTGDIAFSKDGGKLVTIGENYATLSVWDISTGLPLAEGVGGSRAASFHVVVFSPDGNLVASSAPDNGVYIWDIKSKTPLHGFIEEPTINGAFTIAFSPDGQYLAVPADRTSVLIWNVKTGQITFRLSPGHTDDVKCVAWSHNSQWVASAGWDCSVRVTDINTGQLVADPLLGHDEAVVDVKFSPDSSRVISTSYDGTVRLWDIAPRMLSRMSRYDGHGNWVHAVAISSDGSFIASGDHGGKVILRTLHTGSPQEDAHKVFEGHEDWIVCVAFAPDGKSLFTGSHDGVLRIWDCDTPGKPQLIHHLDVEDNPCGLQTFSIALDGHQMACALDNNTVALYNIHGVQPLIHVQNLQGHSSKVRAVAYIPNDRSRIVSAAEDGSICVWNTFKGEVSLGPLHAHEGSALAVAATSDGRRIVSAGGDNAIRLWDARTGEPLNSFKGHESIIHSIHLSADDSYIVSGSRDRTIRIWDCATGDQLCPPLYGHEAAVLAVVFSKDGRLLLSGSADNTIALWNVDPTRKTKWPEMSTQTMVGSKTVRALDGQGNVLHRVTVDSAGWATQDGNKLFWVPPWLRKGLCLPPQIGVLGTNELYVDFRNFVHGKEWTRCRRNEEGDEGRAAAGVSTPAPTRASRALSAASRFEEVDETLPAEKLAEERREIEVNDVAGGDLQDSKGSMTDSMAEKKANHAADEAEEGAEPVIKSSESPLEGLNGRRPVSSFLRWINLPVVLVLLYLLYRVFRTLSTSHL
ncbi:WD40-repeat-containing domain protein [Amylostereum chailletii]|nr:WD40-repeat-containing domain protein [Amylostereum chailletii]